MFFHDRTSLTTRVSAYQDRCLSVSQDRILGQLEAGQEGLTDVQLHGIETLELAEEFGIILSDIWLTQRLDNPE